MRYRQFGACWFYRRLRKSGENFRGGSRSRQFPAQINHHYECRRKIPSFRKFQKRRYSLVVNTRKLFFFSLTVPCGLPLPSVSRNKLQWANLLPIGYWSDKKLTAIFYDFVFFQQGGVILSKNNWKTAYKRAILMKIYNTLVQSARLLSTESGDLLKELLVAMRFRIWETGTF